jgi:3-oxoacyl-[acyl-carrier-protein] synthase-1
MERKGLDFVMLNQGNANLTELYRTHIGDWPKFYKMDTLSKAGFVATELLLKKVGEPRCGSEEFIRSRAIVLFGSTASLCADRNYQETIQNGDNYYPSPALFVYTLPNIVTGEIAIRNHWRGETSFYVLEAPDAAQMAFHLACSFQDTDTESILAGWVDSRMNDDFQVFMTLISREDASDTEWLAGQLQLMINNLNK